MSAARALRFYRQAQFCESRICGVEPCGLRVPQGETVVVHACWLEVQVLHRNKQKVKNMHKLLHVGFQVFAAVLLQMEACLRHSAVISQKISILNTCILEFSKYYVFYTVLLLQWALNHFIVDGITDAITLLKLLAPELFFF